MRTAYARARGMRLLFAACAAATVLSSPLSALAAVAPGQLSMSTERVVVFKDGYGLFAKVATATANSEGRVFTDKVPDAAVLGSFWALAEGNKIVGMRAEWDEQREERTRVTATLTTLEILRANPGKSVTLVYGVDKEKETYAGTLVEVLETMPAPTPTPAQMTEGPVGETVHTIEPLGGQLLVLDTTNGRVVLPIAGIRTVAGKDLVTKITKREEVVTRTKKLSFDLGKEAAGKSVKLRVFYFTPGIRWIPTYRVGGDLDGGKAEIALQGEILNEEEDLIDAAIDLVVGVPNFRFKGTISPLSLERVMQNALVQAAPQLMGQMSNGNDFSNASFASRAGEFHNEAPADSTSLGESGEPDLPPELTAAAAQDHFVYSVKSLSLKKGGRATVPLWQTNAPVRHLYTLDVDVVRNGESYSKSYASMGGGYAAGRSPMRMMNNDVWHQLELGNPGSIPWTTGAAFVTSGFMPVAQELLGYTPAGGRTLLPVTIAPDIRGEYEEEEIERRASARKWNGVTYAQLKKKGTVSVKNHRKEKATMQVRVQVGGKAESATGGGKIRLDEHRAGDWSGYAEALNNHSEVTWELTLNPGESRDLDYTFSFYAR